jgi:hypothetical protein
MHKSENPSKKFEYINYIYELKITYRVIVEKASHVKDTVASSENCE